MYPLLWRAAAALLAVGVGGGCAADSDPRAKAIATPVANPRYSTIHDTMPDEVHRATHRAADRPDSTRARGRGIRGYDARLSRIQHTKDAWLDFALVREGDGPESGVTDTITLLMNCNADSMITYEASGLPVSGPLLIPAHSQLTFSPTTRRIRLFGLRPILRGKASETLVRTALGGDLVLLTAEQP
jgi:hypothetical protein